MVQHWNPVVWHWSPVSLLLVRYAGCYVGGVLCLGSFVLLLAGFIRCFGRDPWHPRWVPVLLLVHLLGASLFYVTVYGRF